MRDTHDLIVVFREQEANLMGLRIIILDSNGKELENENNVVKDIIFESEEAIEFFIHSIKNSLLLSFQYKVIEEKKSEQS